MKKTALIVLTLIFMTSFLSAQKKPPAQVSKASIEIQGATLQLGMTKAEVADKLADITDIDKTDKRFWLIGKKPQSWPDSLHFSQEKLVYATRSWRTGGDDPVQALFGAVSSLGREGFRACKVSTDTVTEPGEIEHRVWIDCGLKSISVRRMQVGDNTFEEVVEVLGVIPE